MQEIILKVKYFERGLSKSLKKVTSFFLLNPVLSVDKIIKNKRDLEQVTSRYSGYEQVQKNPLISYVLSDQV